MYSILQNICVRTVLTALVCFVLASGVCSAQQTAELRVSRTLTLNDVLEMEQFGNAIADPAGRFFIFEKNRAYRDWGDYSLGIYALKESGSQLWYVDSQGEHEPHLLPGLDPAASHWIHDLSPDGRYLSFYSYKLGEMSLSAYDLPNETFVTFDAVPEIGRVGEFEPVWVDSAQIAFAALPSGEQPILSSVRPVTGATLSRAWVNAWTGAEVTASVVQSPDADKPPEQAEGRLILAEAGSGATRILSEGAFTSLAVSPNGRHIAALAQSKPVPINPNNSQMWDQRRYSLVIFDLAADRISRPYPEIEFAPYTLAWDPASTRLTGFGWGADQSMADGQFQRLDIPNGSKMTFAHTGLELTSERERGWLQRPERAMIVGDRLLVYARPSPMGAKAQGQFSDQEFFATNLPRADWYSIGVSGLARNLTHKLEDVSPIPVYADRRSFVVSSTTGLFQVRLNGTVHPITQGGDGRYSHFREGTYTTANTAIRPNFENQAAALATGEATQVIPLDLKHHASRAPISLRGDARVLAVSLGTPTSVLFLVNEGGGTQLRLKTSTDVNEGKSVAEINRHLDDLNLGKWVEIKYDVSNPESGAEPQPLVSCLLLPPTARSDRKIPLVIDVYPDIRSGCHEELDPRLTSRNAISPYLWAARGFAYARLATPKTVIATREGPIYRLNEVLERGVDAILSEGVVDPDRVVLFGFSQGGVSALYAASKSKRFAGVIAMSSWADLFSHYFGGAGVFSSVYGQYFAAEASRYEPEKGTTFGLGENPFSKPEAFVQNSPVFRAQEIEAPILLIGTDMDGFPLSQFDEMYGALLRSGKNVTYVRYWGEGHMPSSPKNLDDMWSRFDQFTRDAFGAGQPEPILN